MESIKILFDSHGKLTNNEHGIIVPLVQEHIAFIRSGNSGDEAKRVINTPVKYNDKLEIYSLLPPQNVLPGELKVSIFVL